jgi:carbonic anhydrase
MIDVINDVFLNGNFRYRLKIRKGLEIVDQDGNFPKYPVLVLTCMDPRLDIHRIFQLDPGDVFVLRNAGNLLTSDTLRSILLAVYQYNINYIVVLGHLDCGMAKINMLELRKKVPYEFFAQKLREGLDLFSEIKKLFKPFIDELKNIKQQLAYLKRLQIHKKELIIIGMLYDVSTGWVFEYERFKEFDQVKDFRKQLNAILNEKKIQFDEFFESIEDKIANNDESGTKKEKTVQLKKQDEDIIIHLEKVKDDIISKTNLSISEIDDKLNTQTFLPDIQFPKIHFPRVKIYIPKISIKKR